MRRLSRRLAKHCAEAHAAWYRESAGAALAHESRIRVFPNGAALLAARVEQCGVERFSSTSEKQEAHNLWTPRRGEGEGCW